MRELPDRRAVRQDSAYVSPGSAPARCAAVPARRSAERIPPGDTLKKKSAFPVFTAQFQLRFPAQIDMHGNRFFSEAHPALKHLLPIRKNREPDIRLPSEILRMPFVIDTDHGGKGIGRPVQPVDDAEPGMSADSAFKAHTADGDLPLSGKIRINLRQNRPVLTPRPGGIGPRQGFQARLPHPNRRVHRSAEGKEKTIS